MNDAVTVSQLNRYVNSVLESDPFLSGLFVKGEISNLKKYPSGHLYFNLKDDKATVACVMFKSSAQGLGFDPHDGQQVLLYAKASIYDRDGKFQLYVSTMKQDGFGDLFLAFEKLKEKLQSEGLFELSHKRKIPYLPNKIGVVTSSSGAVLRDVINVLGRRFPDFNMVLVPTQVQGSTAAVSIVQAIDELNTRDDIDVIIVCRGGGSIEDLWCFNEEKVARAVFSSKIPVISAVGHETDFTICDFVADLRAPTPSAAAELVMPIKSECLKQIRQQNFKLAKLLETKLEYSKLKLLHIKQHRVFVHPESLYDSKKEEIDFLTESLNLNLSRLIKQKQVGLNNMLFRLDGLSPLKVLQRGYGVPQKLENNSIIRSVKDVKIGDEITLRVFDGAIGCIVKSIERKGKNL